MTDQPVSTAPVYRTGASLGDIIKSNEAAASIPTVIPDTTATPIQAEPETTATPTPESTNVEPAAPVVPPVEENVVNFQLTEFDEAAAPTPEVKEPQPVQPDWREEAKKDPKAVLKELGVSEFAIELDEHIKRGGNAADYIAAKAIDYTKVSDDALLKDDLRKQYPQFDTKQIDLLYNRKYGVPVGATEEDEQFAQITLQADAYKLRQEKIAEQAKFKIPEPIQHNAAPVQDNTAELQRQREETINWFNEQEATKALNTSKRVAINLGDDGDFNYNIEKPETITRGIIDGEFWRRITSANPKESDASKLVPDIAKLQKIVLHALNPNFEKDLVNYGKSLARRELVKEGQNITPPAKVIPVNPEKKGVDWSSARTGTVGGR